MALAVLSASVQYREEEMLAAPVAMPMMSVAFRASPTSAIMGCCVRPVTMRKPSEARLS